MADTEHVLLVGVVRSDPVTDWVRAGCTCGWEGRETRDASRADSRSLVGDEWWFEHRAKEQA